MKPTMALLMRAVVDLRRENEALRLKLNRITPDIVPYTAEKDIPRGHTVMVRVPKPFFVSLIESIGEKAHR